MSVGDAALTFRRPLRFGVSGETGRDTDFAREAPRESQDFEELVAEHQQLVLRIAYRILGRLEDAQDVSQEVFLRWLRNRDTVGADPRGWLYRVTVNLCNDEFRRMARAADGVALSPEFGVEAVDVSPSAAVLVEYDERKRLLGEGLRELTERERTAVVLRDIEGLSTREAAEAMGIEEVTVRTQVARGRLKLAKFVRGRLNK